jgi:hypothetical protein
MLKLSISHCLRHPDHDPGGGGAHSVPHDCEQDRRAWLNDSNSNRAMWFN